MYEKIRRIEKKQRLSQTETVEIFGITQQAYSHYEKGKREPDYKTLLKLADYFDVSTDYLLGKSIDPTPAGAKSAEEKPVRTVRRESISVSFYGENDDEDLSEEAVEEILDLVQFAREQRRKRNEAKKNKE